MLKKVIRHYSQAELIQIVLTKANSQKWYKDYPIINQITEIQMHRNDRNHQIKEIRAQHKAFKKDISKFKKILLPALGVSLLINLGAYFIGVNPILGSALRVVTYILLGFSVKDYFGPKHDLKKLSEFATRLRELFQQTRKSENKRLANLIDQLG